MLGIWLNTDLEVSLSFLGLCVPRPKVMHRSYCAGPPLYAVTSTYYALLTYAGDSTPLVTSSGPATCAGISCGIIVYEQLLLSLAGRTA